MRGGREQQVGVALGQRDDLGRDVFSELWPAISTWTSASPNLATSVAAVTLFSVAGFKVPWSCSAITNAVTWFSWVVPSPAGRGSG
jgi:hypothetical protein